MIKSLFVAVIGLFPFLWEINSVQAQVNPELTTDEVMQLAGENVDRYRKSDVLISLVDAQGKPVKGAAMEIRQTTQDFLFGALAFDLVSERFEAEKEALFKERFSEVFNFAILPFYWGGYETKAGHPQWNRIDPVLDWCLGKGITCKGHPLAWTHEVGLPAYVRELSLEESEILLHSRIIENVSGFKDRITLWDVVNEPVNTVNWEMAHSDESPTNQNRYRTGRHPLPAWGFRPMNPGRTGSTRWRYGTHWSSMTSLACLSTSLNSSLSQEVQPSQVDLRVVSGLLKHRQSAPK